MAQTKLPSCLLFALLAALLLASQTHSQRLSDTQLSNQVDQEANQVGPARGPAAWRPNRANSYPVKYCNRCEQGECQVLGMQRYSEPRCEALNGLGASCRMWQRPENKTLHFPNMILKCTHVYMQLCPCARGLVCDQGECQRPRRPLTKEMRFDPLASVEEATGAGEREQEDEKANGVLDRTRGAEPEWP